MRQPLVELQELAWYEMRGGGRALVTKVHGKDAVGIKVDVPNEYGDGHWIWCGGGGHHYPEDVSSSWPDGHPLDLVRKIADPETTPWYKEWLHKQRIVKDTPWYKKWIVKLFG